MKKSIANIDNNIVINLQFSCPKGHDLYQFAANKLARLRIQRDRIKDAIIQIDDTIDSLYEAEFYELVVTDNSTQQRIDAYYEDKKALMRELDSLNEDIGKLHKVCKWLYTLKH